MNGSSVEESFINASSIESLRYDFNIEGSKSLMEIKSFLVSTLCENVTDVATATATTATKSSATATATMATTLSATATTSASSASIGNILYDLTCKNFIETFLNVPKLSTSISGRGTSADGDDTSDDNLANDDTTNATVQISFKVSNRISFFNTTNDVIDDLDQSCKDDLTDCVRKMFQVSHKISDISSKIGVGCHEYLSDWNPVLDGCKFWIDGIPLCAIGIFGLCGNTLALVVLGSTKDSNR